MKIVPYLIMLLSLTACSCGSGRFLHAGPVQVKLEIPGLRSDDDIVKHLGYTVSYNHKTLCPNWVAYELTSDEVQGEIKGKESFHWDPNLKGRQPNREDYKNDMQWDKGHMAPKADMKWSLQAYEESFYLTNICPQNHSFNAGIWCTTEKVARRAAGRFGRVYVVCGPIFENGAFGYLGESRVFIPDKFYKALLVPKGDGYSAIAFILNNSPENRTIKESSMSVDSLESIIGLDLFHNLADSVEETVESKVLYGDWNL